jgi:MFS family permease
VKLDSVVTDATEQAYMFYQLKSFDESLPDPVIATQAGLMASSFTGAQFLTAMMWGRISDASWGGRKTVLLIGIFGTCISCLGFGFSKTFWQAMLFRTMGGALNGNVGVMRTMVSEIVVEKK